MQLTKIALLAAASLAMAACNQQRDAASNEAAADAKPVAATDHKDPAASAMAAAPASIARAATIVTANPDGSMTTVREGSNGWTCMPDNPITPGPDPMCMDGNAAKWAAAWIGKKEPPANTVGIMYMLEGGTDASNVDPYAKGPTEGNAWIETGPHIMVVGSKEALAGYPSGPKPDTSAPYVMWADTPYAHLMIPVDKS
ncbi:MAG TPA: hypothetical protein VFK58_01715 [Sphingomicrobium sp.]|nr:hypothetical protein [Sphingomicrobium sp.]